MANRLKDLKITSTDLVEQGANPDAHIRLFKRRGGADPNDPGHDKNIIQKAAAAIAETLAGLFGKAAADPEPVAKDAKTFDEEMERERLRRITCQLWDFCYALSDSLSSIVCDGELTEDGKRDMMFTSLDEFGDTMRDAIPIWAAGDKVNVEGDGNVVAKSTTQQAALAELQGRYVKAVEVEIEIDEDDDEDDPDDEDVEAGKGKKVCKESIHKSATGQTEKEETDTMKIDKSKMTPDERAALEAIEKKYGTAEPEGDGAADTGTGSGDGGGDVTKGGAATATPELHPEVKKALDENAALRTQMEAMQKSLEIKDLTVVAKRYEIIGKNAEELAEKLYGLKKAGGTHYDDTVALLDEQVALVEKGGLFAEIGTARVGASGTDTALGAKAAELRKSNTDMSSPEAVIKAFEDNPELAAQYEADYAKGGRR
jgi:hypothetical protein